MKQFYSFHVMRWVVGSLLISFVWGACKPLVDWRTYIDFPFAEKCPGYPKGHPLFSEPVDCYTRNTHEELALSIANGMFDCKKWCVYSFKDTDTAWIWTPGGQCWARHSGCLQIPEEVSFAVEYKAEFCPLETSVQKKSDCVELIPTHEHNLNTIKKKCPRHHSQAKPAFHKAVVCETGRTDSELQQALVNGAFSDCKNWCVYSLINPLQVAWFWEPTHDCWKATNDCVNIAAERDYAVKLKSQLCTEPCSNPRRASSLSPLLLQLKCPGYTEDHSPQFHKATICDSNKENMELKEALANFAFSECQNWCVYSLQAPMDVAWIWSPTELCWRESPQCLSLEAEIDFAVNLRNTLCMRATEKFLTSRRKQRATPEPEDTGLWGDEETQQDAIDMYKIFAWFVAALVALVVVLQCLVAPADDSNTDHNCDNDKDDSNTPSNNSDAPNKKYD